MMYKITVSGCDDSTAIEIELTDEQFAFCKTLADQITQASEYGCMPIMRVDQSPIRR